MSCYDRPSHRVLMTFFVRSGWNVAFLEADCRNSLPRKYTFSDPKKIRELAQRGQATQEILDDLENDITNGRGGCWLELTSEQYSMLKQPR